MPDLPGGIPITAELLTIPLAPKLAIADLLRSAGQLADGFATQAAAIDQPGAFPVEEFEQLARAGFLTAPLRPDLGGCGLGIDASTTHDLLRLLKQIGRGNLAIGRVYEGHVNALQLIQTFGTAAQIERYGREAREEQKLFGVWNAEDAEGLNLLPIGPNRYRLQGAKTFCSGGGYVERPFVNGKLPDGSWQMCIVPMDEVQTRCDRDWWQPMGMRATASYKIDFSGVELGTEALIGEPGDYLRQPWLTAGVVRFAAVQLGGAEALFDFTRQYLQGEGRTEHPYQQERLGQMAIALESGNLWLRGAADRLAAYDPQFGGTPQMSHPHLGQLVAYANMMRTAIEQICIDTMQLCQRSVGTRGLLSPHPMERVIRDLTLYLRQPAFDVALAGVGAYALAQTIPADRLWQA
ncbi:MAG: acyl-CoA/acyl-ACP dehydrogenase [Tildeniella torsiva UHER 1998/13D]|jgi:alkylation response protein AidB-like acyl-CoA dehydrogenase|nr:acyl-CoA/acyl-ACP dehydrogenase [Tildeniella torsiva UHER 1998/13D]